MVSVSRLRLPSLIASSVLMISLLGGCQSSSTEASSHGNSGTTPLGFGFAAYKDICIASAPSFKTALARAKKYGVQERQNMTGEIEGFSPQHRMMVSVKPDMMCNIVMPKSPTTDEALKTEFRQAIAKMIKPNAFEEEELNRAHYKGGRYLFDGSILRGVELYTMLNLTQKK